MTLLVITGLLLASASVALGRGATVVTVAVAGGLAFVAWRDKLGWPQAAAGLIAVGLFIPMARFTLPLGPFALSAYHIAAALVLACWAAALLVDPDVRLRRTPFDVPIAILVAAVLGSIAVNPARVEGLGTPVLKAVTFFFGFVLIYYCFNSIIRRGETVAALTKLIVAGAAAISALAIVEQRTGVNVFDRIGSAIPVLRFGGEAEAARFGLTRAVGSASHPIEMGVILAMVLPLGLALSFSRSRYWAIPTAVVVIGVMASVSRTPVVVCAAVGLVLLWLQPKDFKRLLPLLVALVPVVAIALPGSMATVRNLFFPKGGLVAEHERLAPEADPLLAGGRVRLLGPSLDEAGRTPLLGQGFGTRQTGFANPLRNAPILDNQWLGTLLETGIVGVLGWLAVISVAARRLASASRRRAGPDGWLAAGFAASIVGFGVAMFTFDALAFSEVSMVFWIVFALAAALLSIEAREAR